MRRSPLAVVLAAAVLLALVSSARADWVTERGTITHTSAVDGAGLATPLSVAWTRTLGDTGKTEPLIAGGRIFTIASSGTGTALTALSPADGHTLWSRNVAGTQMGYDAGRIFLISSGGTLTAIDAATGVVAWSAALPGQYLFSSTPTASGGVVYVGGAGSGGTLYAVRESDGAVLWTQGVANGDNSSPALSGGRVIVSYVGPQVYAFDASSGQPAWHQSGCCSGGGGATPVVANGRIWIYDWSSSGHVLRESDGGELDTFGGSQLPAVSSSLAVFSLAGGLHAQDPATGLTRWDWTHESPGRPIIGGDLVFTRTDAGALVALGAADGAVKQSLGVGDGAGLVVAGGGLLVTLSNTGVVTAIKGSGDAGPPTPPSPTTLGTTPTFTAAPATPAPGTLPAPAAAPQTTPVLPASASPVKAIAASCRPQRIRGRTITIACLLPAAWIGRTSGTLRYRGATIARSSGKIAGGKLTLSLRSKRKLRRGTYSFALRATVNGRTQTRTLKLVLR